MPRSSKKIKESDYKACFVGCVILTKDQKILIQQRDNNFSSFPGYLSEFGGRIAEGETPSQALIRELKEELGATVHEDELISLGIVTEAISGHIELVYAYFWHDIHGTITGCYEGIAIFFDNVDSILEYPKITDALGWMLFECKNRKLLITT